MEENVALDTTKQKQFVKSLKGLKKLMKKTGAITEKPVKENKPIKDGKITKKKRQARGLVYLSHIPHGFYEHQMTQYFKQFGVVTNARVIRSKHTGRSKGHAFVEFKDTAVAEIVAETMNNYLMGKRLIKAVYIPPKDQRKNARRKNWNAQNNLGNTIKLSMKKAYNAEKNENEDLKIASKLLTNLSNTKKKLKELGIDYDFFTPVDVPEGLAEKVIVKEESNDDDKKDLDVKPKNNNKNLAKESSETNDKKDNNIGEIETDQKGKKKRKQKKITKTTDVSNDKKIEATVIDENSSSADNAFVAVKDKSNKKNKKEKVSKPKVNKTQQEQKQQKLKETGIVKLPEDFIKLGEGDEDSDSSYQFDSDEYENMINNEDEPDSNESVNDDGEDSNEESLVIDERKSLPVKTNKNKGKKIVVQPKESNKAKAKQVLKQQQTKRKGSERLAEVQSKKPKFEKQSNKKFLNKQMKKMK